jgi:hypothetical protein
VRGEAGGPAAEAIIRVDDVIVAVNGTWEQGREPPHQLSSILHGVKRCAPERAGAAAGKPLGSRSRRAVARLLARHDMDFNFALRSCRSVRQPTAAGHGAHTLTPTWQLFWQRQGVLVVRAPADGTLRLEDGT